MKAAWRMRRAVSVFSVPVLIVVGVLGGGAALAQGETRPGETQALELEQAFRNVFEQVKPGVVTVFPETAELSFAEKIRWGVERMPQAIGSGFIVDKRGYVITNEHVVREGQKFSVLLSDGTKYDGRLVGRDQLLDIALVRIVTPSDERGKEFSTVPLGDSDELYPGMWAIALGNPIGFFFDDSEPVVTVGIISGLNRTFVGTLHPGDEVLRTYGGMIQTDAAINPGNSGGPLLNIRGEVIGVNTLAAMVPGEARGNIGINFAVPINTVKRKKKLLQKGYGVRRPMRYGTIDAKLDTLSELYAETLHLKGRRGVFVRQVIKGGAAAKAGLKYQDVILKVNGQKVVNDAQLVCLVSHYPVGEVVALEVWRVVENEPVTVTINVTLSGKTIRELEADVPRSSDSE